MITNKEIEQMSFEMAQAFEEINLEYIRKMSAHIKSIGRLTEDDLHTLEQMNRMKNNIKEINAAIELQCKITSKELERVYARSGVQAYNSLGLFYKAKNIKQFPFYKNYRMTSYLQSVAKLTEQAFDNLSKSTAIEKSYKKAVDRGIYAVTNGLEDYNAAVRSAVRDATINGTKVEYASGYKRRIDSAAKMNILDGARQVQNGIRQIAGQEFGADGVEISAHALCAPDHLEIQGLQLSNEEFEELNNSLERPIGELNCHHTYYPIVLGVSGRAYTDDELQEYEEYSNETIKFADKELTRYEADQGMRQIETKIREQQEIRLAAEGYGDETLQRKCNDNIDVLNKKYTSLAKAAELRKKPDRTKIPETKKYKKQATRQYRRLFTN